ncbi:MAG: tripartite tricarboxylate transporter TctB family protein [Desulfobacterales bacterium]|jgi:hypothetical protein|nr:tripartite tricarboxylate transporter TctB family protein [Desulfobacterales bacterium]
MMAPTKRQGEIGTALVLLAIACFLIISAARMPAGTVALPGPGLMPMAIGVLLAATAAGLLLGQLKRRLPLEPETLPLGGRHLLVAAGGLVWVSLFFERLGFLICMGLFLLVLSKEFSRAGWFKPIVFALAGVFGAYWFFVVILGVQLPLGPL